MSRGAVLIARNNSDIDYIKQAVFSAKRIKQYLDLPVSIVTDSPEYLQRNFDFLVFDEIIPIENVNDYTFKKYYDGTWTRKSLEFKNTSRMDVYDLSPYTETLLLDTDYIVSNNLLSNCFDQKEDFLIYKKSFDLAGWRNIDEFQKINNAGIDFYWATVVFFRKTDKNKIFFELLKHIKENWPHYRTTYQISTTVFRNDFAFSIAIHIMNGYQLGDFAGNLPGTLFYTTDRDLVHKIDNDTMTFLIEKENSAGNYFSATVKNSNVHIMNKYSLGRIIDNDY